MITQQDVDKFLRKVADQMVQYTRVKYDAPNFSPIIQVTFARNRTISRGGVRDGRSFISIVARRFLAAAQGTGMMNEPEYTNFNSDPVIGGLYEVSWKKALASLVAHELGHAIQYDKGTKVGAKRVLGIENLDDSNEVLRGHDWFWKRIYADLRTQFVNNDQFDVVQPIAPALAKPAAQSTGVLYVKYAYKGNSTITRFYIDQKLKATIVETNRQFYKADDFGDIIEKLPFTTLAEARIFLIGQ